MPSPPAPTLPEPDRAREWLATMTLIRRFEERAGEMYARAKVGGFLHLSIGEEATIVGSARALREDDYLISTYRSHGHALVRGTPPENVMAELFGRVDGCSRGRGGSMHMFDLARRFMGGYGIVGGNLPIAAGIALASDYQGTDEVTLCTFGDGASNQGTFGETLNIAALWRLPVVFMVTNNQFGMGTALRRHSAVTDLQRKGESLGVPGMRCDGMDVLDTHAVVGEAVRARARGPPAGARRGGHLPLPRPLDGRPRAVPHARRRSRRWRERDPLPAFGELLVREGVIERGRARADRRAGGRAGRRGGGVRRGLAVPGAPSRCTTTCTCSTRGARLVLGADHRRAGGRGSQAQPPDGAAPAANDEIPQQLTEALAAGEDGRESPDRLPRGRQPRGAG